LPKVHFWGCGLTSSISEKWSVNQKSKAAAAAAVVVVVVVVVRTVMFAHLHLEEIYYSNLVYHGTEKTYQVGKKDR